ncbi:MAG: DUF4013 domain-containing protein [Chloroflexi bacterium]|nr:DUF4013 domain-containing protein [Chloroflexota bacterium]
MYFLDAIIYPFRDGRWPFKLGPIFALQYIPLLGQAIARGYEAKISQGIHAGVEQPMPTWGDFFKHAGRGLAIYFAQFIYQLPTIIFTISIIALWILPFFTGLFSGTETIEQAFQAAWQRWLGAMGPRLALSCAALFYATLATMSFHAGYLRYIQTERYLAFFEIIPNLRLMLRNLLPILTEFAFTILTLVIVALVSWMVSLTGVGVAFVPGFAFTFLTYTNGYSIGQLANEVFEAEARRANPTPQRPLNAR